MTTDLPIIQKTYNLIKWYVPILNRLPRDHRFQLGDRMVAGLYERLEILILARYQREKLPQLQAINSKLDVLRYQTRLLLDFELLSKRRCRYVGEQINAIGTDLGGWIKQRFPECPHPQRSGVGRNRGVGEGFNAPKLA